jgi:hypothetical protein
LPKSELISFQGVICDIFFQKTKSSYRFLLIPARNARHGKDQLARSVAVSLMKFLCTILCQEVYGASQDSTPEQKKRAFKILVTVADHCRNSGSNELANAIGEFRYFQMPQTCFPS